MNMMLLRKQIEINQTFSERSDKYIFAERIGNTYAIKFIRFGKLRINMRVYLVDKAYFDRLVTNYGKLVTSYSVVDRYLVLPRKQVEIWVARHKHTTNVFARYPSGMEQQLHLTFEQAKNLAPKPLEWRPFEDENNRRWLVAQFTIGKPRNEN